MGRKNSIEQVQHVVDTPKQSVKGECRPSKQSSCFPLCLSNTWGIWPVGVWGNWVFSVLSWIGIEFVRHAHAPKTRDQQGAASSVSRAVDNPLISVRGQIWNAATEEIYAVTSEGKEAVSEFGQLIR